MKKNFQKNWGALTPGGVRMCRSKLSHGMLKVCHTNGALLKVLKVSSRKKDGVEYPQHMLGDISSLELPDGAKSLPAADCAPPGFSQAAAPWESLW